MQPKTRDFLTSSLLATWLAVCLALFILASRTDYLQYFKFPSWSIFFESLGRIDPARYCLNLFTALCGVLIFSTTSLSLGSILLKKQAKTLSPNSAMWVSAFVLGEVVFSLAFLILINLNRLTPMSITMVLLLGFLAGAPTLRSWIPYISRPALPRDFQLKERLILGLLSSIFLFGLLYSSARLGYDAVAEYFSHAKIMAVSQRPIFFYPTDSFVVSSFHPGILLTAIIQLFGDQAARMLPWVNGLAMLSLGLALGKELGLSPRARLWFLTLMLTSTAFVDLLGDGKIELISTAPILAALYWMLRSVEQPSKNAFLLIGTLAGFAIIARPYNIFLVTVFILLFYASHVYLQIKAGTFHAWQFFQPMFWVLPPLILLGAFHLFENWFFLNSPIAPLTYARDLKTNIWQWQFNPAQLNAYRLFYPFVVTFINSPQSLGNISPLFVAFLPFLLIKKIRQNIRSSIQMGWLVAIALVTLVLWIALFFTVVEIRYIFFLWIILFLFMAQTLDSVIENEGELSRLLVTPLFIGLLLIITGRTLIIPLETYSPIDENGQAHCYSLVICTFFDTVNQNAALGDRVFVLNAYRYYLRPDLFACSSRSDEYPVLQKIAAQNSPDFWVEAYRQGYHYVIYETNFSVRHSHFGTIPEPNSIPSWLHVEAIPVYSQSEDAVYRIEATNAPYAVETRCVQKEAGNWEVQTER